VQGTELPWPCMLVPMYKLTIIALLLAACDSDPCDTTSTTTTGEPELTTSVSDTSSSTGEPPEVKKVGDGCSAWDGCNPGEPLPGQGGLKCLLPWSYCTSFCDVDAQCAVANYVNEFDQMVVFTCETFPDGLKMCFANAD